MVKNTYDVIVAGGGPAGSMAAIASARAGADTLLIERANCAGGMWTSGLLSWMLDVTNKGGILKEMTSSLIDRHEGYYARSGNFITYPESVKCILDDLLEAAGVHVLYYTTVVDAETRDGHLISVVTQSKAGKREFSAAQFVDATGDGDLAAYAGCRFEIGRSGDGSMQPASLIALMTGVSAEAVRRYNNTLPYLENKNAKQLSLEKMREAGVEPSYSAPSFFHIGEDIWLMMTTHAYNIDPLDPESLTIGTIDNRKELYRQQQAMRALGGDWEKMRIVASAPYLGIREARRIAGRYTVTLQDALDGRRHDDAVCRVEFGLDVHALKPDAENGASHKQMRAQPFDIPLRALESADIDNLLLAGRLISGDFFAHSAYRVTGDAAALGEAAGREAARRVLVG